MSIFDKQPIAKSSHGTFPLNKMHTSTMDFFRWDVAHCMPLVPNDVVNLNLHSFIQAAPNPFPINGRMSVGMYAFYVPSRIVWDGWTKYITDLQSGLTMPYFTIYDLWDVFNTPASYIPVSHRSDAKKFLSNIMNLASLSQWVDAAARDRIPSKIGNLKLSAIPLRCCQRIWFDWMRDKAHISDAALSSYCVTTGGHISLTELTQLCFPKYRLYAKNYITTAFDSPSEVNSGFISSLGSSDEATLRNSQSLPASKTYGAGNYQSSDGSELAPQDRQHPNQPNLIDGEGFSISQIFSNIQDLRSSNSLQNYAERMLVAGKTVLSRFQALFGTNPTIEELQMSDYLGGHEEDLLFNTSMASASTAIKSTSDPLQSTVLSYGADPKVGTLQGQKGQDITSAPNGVGLENVTYKTDEHGYLFVFSAITPLPQYWQGVDRDWFRGLDTFGSDKFDFFHSDFENEGLQPVLNYEVCLSDVGDSSYDPKGIFGFQQKYMDYKYSKDSLGGDFTMAISESVMKPMHLGRDVQKLVEDLALADGSTVNSKLTPSVLTQTTIKDKEDYDSKFTITNTEYDHFIVNHKIEVTASRPMMQNAMPALSASESRSTAKDLVETSGFRL